MLRRIRTDKITEKVTECAGNTKKLYSLVSYLTRLEIENPMPPGKTDGKLAEEFAEYFIAKTSKLYERVWIITRYIHPGTQASWSLKHLNKYQKVM